MSWIDLAIIGAVGLALVFGLVKGFVRPLLFDLCFLLGLLLASQYESQLSHALGPRPLLRGTALVLTAAAVIALALLWPGQLLAGALLRIPGLTTADHFLGAAVHALLGFALVYLLVGGLVALEHAVEPLLTGQGELTASQIHDFAAATARDPVLRILVDGRRLRRLEDRARSLPVSPQLVEDTEPAVGFYVRALRVPLESSQLTPVVLRLGERLPLIGRPIPLSARCLRGRAEKPSTDLRRLCGPSAVWASVRARSRMRNTLPHVLGASLHPGHLSAECLAEVSGRTSSGPEALAVQSTRVPAAAG